MDVFFYNTADKLPSLPTTAAPRQSNGPWFWVVHSPPEKFFSDPELRDPVERCLGRGGGILMVSGMARCGLSEERARELERQRGERIHILRVSCGPWWERRVAGFLELVGGLQPHEPIAWSAVEPEPASPYLCSLYLVLSAMAARGGTFNGLVEGWDAQGDEWKRHFWEMAWAEFTAKFPDDDSGWSESGLPDFKDDRFARPRRGVSFGLRGFSLRPAIDLLKSALTASHS